MRSEFKKVKIFNIIKKLISQIALSKNKYICRKKIQNNIFTYQMI